MQPGTDNAITDVAGLRVGHTTRDEPGWLTGVTVVVPPPGTVGGVDVRGGGPGTRETDLLDPRNLVSTVDAVVLAGGSAFGLAAADGVAAAVYGAGGGWPVGPEPHERVAVVPAAILFDLGRGGSWLHHPSASDGAAAYGRPQPGRWRRARSAREPERGRAACAEGSARHPPSSTRAPRSARWWSSTPSAPPSGPTVGCTPRPSSAARTSPTPDPQRAAAYWAARAEESERLRAGIATTLAVLATDVTLTKAGCQKLAGVGHDGMARALSPVHTSYDGDTVFALSTAVRPTVTGLDEVELQTAAADCVSVAIVRAVLSATSVDRTADGGVALPSYRDALVGP